MPNSNVPAGAPPVAPLFFYFPVGSVLLDFVDGIWNSKLGRGVTVSGHEPPLMDLPH